MRQTKASIIVCINHRDGHQLSCAGAGSENLAKKIETHISEKNLDIDVQRIQCFGRCTKGPVLRIAPGGDFFEGFDENSIEKIIAETLKLSVT